MTAARNLEREKKIGNQFVARALQRFGRRERTRDWQSRWEIAGTLVGWQGAIREGDEEDGFFALADSPIWATLGSSLVFPDATDMEVPPFAWNSGMAWAMVPDVIWRQKNGHNS